MENSNSRYTPVNIFDRFGGIILLTIIAIGTLFISGTITTSYSPYGYFGNRENAEQQLAAVSRDPDSYYNQYITLEGTITEVVSDTTLILTESGQNAKPVVVVSPYKVTQLPIDEKEDLNGQSIEATGVIEKLDETKIDEIENGGEGVNLEKYEGSPVIVAQRIELS